jgi:putative oxidoreductase
MKPLLLAKSAHAAFERHAGAAALSALLLFVRVVWGYAFFLAGRGKLADISKPIAFFTSLGIPAPTLNAYFIGTLECVGGLLLLAGLFARPVAFLLVGNMIVAYLTADRQVFAPLFTEGNPKEFMDAAPFWFLVASLLVTACGPGLFSLDRGLSFLMSRLKVRTCSAHPAAGSVPSPLAAQRA